MVYQLRPITDRIRWYILSNAYNLSRTVGIGRRHIDSPNPLPIESFICGFKGKLIRVAFLTDVREHDSPR
jgi:hypothetical protein